MKKAIASILVFNLFCQPLAACLWDYDTLAMERRKFPSALGLITGKFLRHSDAYYQWRIADRNKKLESDSGNPGLIDDLAVAYDKTGQHEKAIELMLKSKTDFPDRYETAANLGTFYIHSGDFEKGLTEIKRALEINPDAHFGREEYQKLLVEYLLERRTATENGKQRTREESFPNFIIEKKFPGTRYQYSEQATNEIKNATKGILGMMRFGNYDSPVLLEALGELLVHPQNPDESAHRLAGRAFLKASYEARDEAEQKRLRKKARASLGFQTSKPNVKRHLQISELEATFAKELEEAAQWSAEVLADEENWIRENKDVDAEFSKKYYQDPSHTQEPSSAIVETAIKKKLPIAVPIALGVIAMSLFVVAIANRQKSKDESTKVN